MAANEKALAVTTTASPVIKGLITPESTELLNNYLGDSGFSAEDLYQDMAGAMTLKPALARCTKESLFHCLLYAAKHHASFGMYGVELVPRGIKDEDASEGEKNKKIPTAVPQLSYRYKIEAGKRIGIVSRFVERVYEGEKFRVVKDGGMPVSIEHDVDYTKPRTGKEGLVCAYGIAALDNGRRVYKILSRAEIDKSEKAKATSGTGIWGTHYDEMVAKTVEHRLHEFAVGNFTFGLGTSSGPPLPPGGGEDDEVYEADFSRVDESAEVAGELDSRSRGEPELPWPEGVPEGMHHAATLRRGFDKTISDNGSLEKYWNAHGKGLVLLAGKDEQDFMLKMKDALKPPPPLPPEDKTVDLARDAQTALPIDPPHRPDLPPEIAAKAVNPGVISDAVRAYQQAYQKLGENDMAVHQVQEVREKPWMERANAEEKQMLTTLGQAMVTPVAQWLKAKAESGGQS